MKLFTTKKKLKYYGDSMVINFNKEDIEIYKLKEGMILNVTLSTDNEHILKTVNKRLIRNNDFEKAEGKI